MAGEAPASTGKTVAIAVTIPVAFEDVIWTVLHEIWGLDWASPRFVSSLVLVASFMVAGLMHRSQRKKERENGAGTDSDSNGVAAT